MQIRNGVSLDRISKSFGGVEVLHSVSMDFEYGAVQALIGANGAGKSTLMKILSGQYSCDSGSIYKDGVLINIASPKAAQNNGISIINQELNYVPEMTVAENIFLGREPLKNGSIDYATMRRKTNELFSILRIDISPDTKMKFLRLASKQMIEIAKAVSLDADVLIMDEPTSSLTYHETATLFQLVKVLVLQNKSIVFISHKLDEIYKICDRITVLRDGRCAGTWNVSELPNEELVKQMVGKSIGELYPKHEVSIGDEIFRAEKLSIPQQFNDISFCLRQGEILGIGGLVGAGRTETMQAIVGLRKLKQGKLYLNGKLVEIRNVKDAIRLGIAYLPEDRKNLGLVLKMSVADNIALPSCKTLYSAFGSKTKRQEFVDDIVEKLQIKVNHVSQKAISLSGGNQQKVVFGKWIATKPCILILDEPTRGVDVGAKSDIYNLIVGFVNQGNAAIMISSEIEELIGMSDRIIVFANGCISGELDKENFTREQIMQYEVTSVGSDA